MTCARSAPAVTLPLSAAQRGIWYAQERDPDNPAHFMACALDLYGVVDELAFASAVRTALAEADGIRATFAETDGALSQRITDTGDWQLPVQDLSAADDPETAAEKWMHDRHGSFRSHAGGLLIDLVMLRLSETRRSWYVGYHQLVADGAGIYVFIRRAVEVYNAFVKGRPATEPWFPPLRDYLDEEQRYPSSQRYAEAERYFADRLADHPAPTRLSGSTLAATGAERRRVIDVPPAGFERLRAAATRLGTRWFGLVTAALAVQVAGTCGTDDVVLSLVVNGRETSLARATPTRAANVLPLRITVRRDITVGQLVRQISADIDDLRRYQRHRGEDLRRSFMAGDGGIFFGPMINFVPWQPNLTLCGAEAHLRTIATISPTEDFAVYCYKTAESGMQLVLDGNPARLDDGEMDVHDDRLVAGGEASTGYDRNTGFGHWSGLHGDVRVLRLHERH